MCDMQNESDRDEWEIVDVGIAAELSTKPPDDDEEPEDHSEEYDVP